MASIIPKMAMRDPICIMVQVDQYNDMRSSPSQNCNASRAYASIVTITVDVTTQNEHRRIYFFKAAAFL